MYVCQHLYGDISEVTFIAPSNKQYTYSKVLNSFVQHFNLLTYICCHNTTLHTKNKHTHTHLRANIHISCQFNAELFHSLVICIYVCAYLCALSHNFFLHFYFYFILLWKNQIYLLKSTYEPTRIQNQTFVDTFAYMTNRRDTHRHRQTGQHEPVQTQKYCVNKYNIRRRRSGAHGSP